MSRGAGEIRDGCDLRRGKVTSGCRRLLWDPYRVDWSGRETGGRGRGWREDPGGKRCILSQGWAYRDRKRVRRMSPTLGRLPFTPT